MADGVAFTVSFNGHTYSGMTSSQGTYTTPYFTPGAGTYHANALYLIHGNYVWNPLDMDLEDDSDGDGKPDGALVLTR